VHLLLRAKRPQLFRPQRGPRFETKIFVKQDAPELLRKELSSPGYKPATGLGKSLAGDTAAKARHGTQGGAASSARTNSPRIPMRRAGVRGGGPTPR